MAVSELAASDSVPHGPSGGPVRTCIGCRRRAAAVELFRVVIDRQTAAGGKHAPAVAVVASRRGAPGRGAWLHPDPECVALARRRRAFARALRVDEADITAVERHAAAHLTSSSGTPAGDEPT